MLRAALLMCAMLVTGCGGYSPTTFPPVAGTDMLTRVVGHPAFKALDARSFAEAKMLYPTRTGTSHHIVPIGDYLLSDTVQAIPEDAAVTTLRLASFSSVCAASGFLAPQARCQTAATFDVTTIRGPTTLKVEAAPDVGPLMIVGDIAPPFTWGDQNVEVIHKEARAMVDALQTEMKKAFATLPKRGG